MKGPPVSSHTNLIHTLHLTSRPTPQGFLVNQPPSASRVTGRRLRDFGNYVTPKKLKERHKKSFRFPRTTVLTTPRNFHQLVVQHLVTQAQRHATRSVRGLRVCARKSAARA